MTEQTAREMVEVLKRIAKALEVIADPTAKILPKVR